MATRCSICNDPRVKSVDALLAQGRSVRSVAAELGVSNESLKRHARLHLGDPRQPAADPASNASDPLIELLNAVYGSALRANNAGMVQQARMLLQMVAERGKAQAVYDVRHDPDWLRLRDILAVSLKPYPEALQAVIDGIRRAIG